MSISIVTDSACDLPQALVDELQISVVPLSIRFGDEEFIDRRDLTVAEFWRRSAASPVLPETAAPPPGAFEETYRSRIAAGATGIVVISLSGGLSATIQSAELAARSITDTPIAVVDSESCTLGLGTIVAAAARAAQEPDATFDGVVALARDLVSRTRVWGALDTLENLKKGGRIGGAKALLASVLSIKPIVEVRNGKVEEGGKQRTRSKALAFLKDKLAGFGEIENLAIMQADCDDVAQFESMIRELYSGPIIVGEIGPVVGSHTGRGTIGFACQVKR